MDSPDQMTQNEQSVIARNDAEALSRIENSILTETWELNRWMLASLLAVNSAAVSVIYPSKEFPHSFVISECILFIFGVFAAIASGFSEAISLRVLSAAVTKSQRYWSLIAYGSSRSADDELELIRIAQRANIIGLIPQATLFLSAILFLTGIIRLY